MTWRAWYTGLERYSSEEVDPVDLPGDGLLAVVQDTGMETPKRQIVTGYDRYFWWDGPEGLVIGGNDDPESEIRARYPGCVVVRGKWTTPQEMAAVREVIRRDGQD